MRIEGLDKVLRNLAKLDTKVWRKDAMKEMRDSHKSARAEMRSNAPEGATKKLRRSIRTQAWTKHRKGGEMAIYVRTGPRLKGKGRVWYAHFPEVGTSHSEATNFIANTKANHETALRTEMESIIRNVVAKANGKA